MEEKLDFVQCIKSELNLTKLDPNGFSSLNLAYIGDDVYDLIIRTYLLNQGNTQVNKINKRANSLVKASAQSAIIGVIMELLDEEELAVYKRGRNAKSATAAKNASINDYRRATGFEALMGYLYLKGNYGRLNELVRIGLEGIGEIRSKKIEE